MTATKRSAALLATVAALALLLGWAPAAHAQTVPGCADEGTTADRVAKAPVAFTGTVVALQDEGRLATVAVVKVWKGGTLPRRVEVHGTIATQAKVHTALDRIYANNRLYLFVPSSGSTPRFIENQCSATRSYASELDALAPAGGGTLATNEPGVSLPGGGVAKVLPLIIGGGAFVLIGGFLVRQMLRDRSRRAAAAA